MDLDIASYKTLFLTTARENLSGMQKDIELLTTNPTDSSALDDLFIKSHSIKGQSMTMGYSGVAKVCLAIEHYFRAIHDGKRQFDQTLLPEFSHACEALSSAFITIEKDDKEPLLAQIITNLEQKLGVKV